MAKRIKYQFYAIINLQFQVVMVGNINLTIEGMRKFIETTYPKQKLFPIKITNKQFHLLNEQVVFQKQKYYIKKVVVEFAKEK